MSLDTLSILNAVQSHAMASGHFERVNRHEPKNAPGNGLSAAIWVDRIEPVQSSGLSSSSAIVTLNIRVYTNMLAEPQDAIDPNIATAVDALIGAYSSDFELGGNVRCVDLLGQSGQGLTAQAGYLEQDHKMYRVMTISLPLIVNDVWSQSP